MPTISQSCTSTLPRTGLPKSRHSPPLLRCICAPGGRLHAPTCAADVRFSCVVPDYDFSALSFCSCARV